MRDVLRDTLIVLACVVIGLASVGLIAYIIIENRGWS